jgi:hypothetical protein
MSNFWLLMKERRKILKKLQRATSDGNADLVIELKRMLTKVALKLGIWFGDEED